ncbi:hypothetical protein AB835_06680 [Candidatus Endobugula sertula]|uniref:Radical SAM core domain-containing protein n=1 Tax=Candidatus Endobugula sertula TaxID=62101 RepID=A0A1D2QQL7_9GAMM|nr:hypothetical protein AB835_06680 [Candidatus Endobugula sertula]
MRDGSSLKTQNSRTGQAISEKDYPYSDYSTSRIEWSDEDFIFSGEHLPIEISRGCIFRCNFCANPAFKRKGELDKESKVLRYELERNYERFKTTGYMFCDDTYNDTIAKVREYHEVISKLPFNLEWTGYGRADAIKRHPEMAQLMAESGLKAMLIGIETLHPIAAKGVGKGLHPNVLKDTLYYMKDVWGDSVTITGSFIVGLPGEPEESIWETVEWLNTKGCPVDEAIFSPLNIRAPTDNENSPMSKISMDPARYGYSLISSDLGKGISSHGPAWENEFMHKARAEELARSAQQSCQDSQPIGNWAVYSRLRSLGYQEHEFKGKSSFDENFLLDAQNRKDIMMQNYYNKLME